MGDTGSAFSLGNRNEGMPRSDLQEQRPDSEASTPSTRALRSMRNEIHMLVLKRASSPHS